MYADEVGLVRGIAVTMLIRTHSIQRITILINMNLFSTSSQFLALNFIHLVLVMLHNSLWVIALHIDVVARVRQLTWAAPHKGEICMSNILLCCLGKGTYLYLKLLEVLVNPVPDLWEVVVLHFSECLCCIFPSFFKGIMAHIMVVLELCVEYGMLTLTGRRYTTTNICVAVHVLTNENGRFSR